MKTEIEAWLGASDAERAPDAFDSLMERFGAPELITGLLRSGRQNIGPIARRAFGSKCLQPKRRDAKTIALFVGRLRGGGAERVVSLLVGILTGIGKKIVLFTQEEPNPLDYPVPEGTERVVLPVSLARWPERVSILQREIEKRGIDVYVHNAEKTPLLLYDLLAVKSTGAFFVSYNHGCFAGLFIEHSPIASSLIDIQRLADLSLVLSSDFARCYQALGIRSRPVSNPMTLDVAGGGRTPPRTETILWVGRRSSVKNYREAVKILRALANRPRSRHKDIRLVMVGEPQDRNCDEELQRIASEWGVRRKLKLVPFVKDVRSMYGSASVLLMTSVCEASPMVIPEAMASGLPIVMYRLPYVETVRGADSVLQVEFGDITGAVDAICSLLDDPRKWCDASAKGLETAKRISDAGVAEQWRSVFDDLLDGKSSEGFGTPDGWFGRELTAILDGQRQNAETIEQEKREILRSSDPALFRPLLRNNRNWRNRFANLVDIAAWRLRQVSDRMERMLDERSDRKNQKPGEGSRP